MGGMMGLFEGLVVVNADPLSQRRLKVTIPGTAFARNPTAWARPVSTVRPPVPAIQTWVCVGFLRGDPEYPVWLGTFSGWGALELTAADHPVEP